MTLQWQKASLAGKFLWISALWHIFIPLFFSPGLSLWGKQHEGLCCLLTRNCTCSRGIQYLQAVSKCMFKNYNSLLVCCHYGNAAELICHLLATLYPKKQTPGRQNLNQWLTEGQSTATHQWSTGRWWGGTTKRHYQAGNSFTGIPIGFSESQVSCLGGQET